MSNQSRAGTGIAGQCMLCRGAFSAPSREHVVPNGLGGRLSRLWMTCASCNGALGSSLDDAFLKALQWITTLVDPKRDRRRAPRVREIMTADGDVMMIEPGGRVRVRHRKVAEGQWIAEADDAARATAAAERAAQARTERTGDLTTVETRVGQILNPTFHFRLELEGHTAFRSAVKSALAALSVAVADGRFLPDTSLDLWRDYVRFGSPIFMSEVGYLEVPVDGELLRSLDHSVLLLQRADRAIYFEVSTYGGVVSVAGALPPICTDVSPWLYRIDPLTGAGGVTHPRLEPPGQPNWNIDPSTSSRSRTLAAIGRIAKLWQKRGDTSALDRMLNECWSEVMTEPGKPIEEHHVKALSARLSERIVDFLGATKRL